MKTVVETLAAVGGKRIYGIVGDRPERINRFRSP